MSRVVEAMQEGRMVRLVLPNRWTPLPGTNVAVQWDGEQAVTVVRDGEF